MDVRDQDPLSLWTRRDRLRVQTWLGSTVPTIEVLRAGNRKPGGWVIEIVVEPTRQRIELGVQAVNVAWRTWIVRFDAVLVVVKSPGEEWRAGVDELDGGDPRLSPGAAVRHSIPWSSAGPRGEHPRAL